MAWPDIYGEFLRNFGRIALLYQQYAKNIESINELYNESIKYIEKMNEIYNEFIKSNEHLIELYKQYFDEMQRINQQWINLFWKPPFATAIAQQQKQEEKRERNDINLSMPISFSLESAKCSNSRQNYHTPRTSIILFFPFL